MTFGNAVVAEQQVIVRLRQIRRRNGMQRLDVVAFPCCQFYQWRSLTYRKLIPLSGVGSSLDISDPGFVGRVIISAQPKFAVVIARDPKRIITSCWRTNISANACTVIRVSVGWSFKKWLAD